MSIKPSASGEIRTLLAAVSSSDDVRRESAIARLAIIGPRAVDRILAAYADADRQTRIALLRTLEAIGDPRALAPAREALQLGGDIAVAAAGTLRSLLDSRIGTTGTDALDALVATALSSSGERRVRLAALEALRDIPAGLRAQIEAALQDEQDETLRTAGAEPAAAEAVWKDLVEGRLPDDPGSVRAAIDAHGASAPLSVLLRLIEALRARESETAAGPAKGEWRAARGAAHQALALRGSTIAVYDLRETLAAASEPLPSTFVTAIHAVGDASCLEAIAAAHASTSPELAPDARERWQAQLEAAFKAVAAREKITRRSAVMKRLEKRWPDLAQALKR